VTVRTTRAAVKTGGEFDIQDLTPALSSFVSKSGVKEGQASAFVGGSTAAITTIEYEPGLVHDMRQALARLFPKDIEYKHHERWGDDNGRSHIRAAFLKPGVSVPVSKGKLLLGQWQQIVLVELDTRPREREVVLQVIGD
jgi:secondary thiamine-phosphate synthase enzyme